MLPITSTKSQIGNSISRTNTIELGTSCSQTISSRQAQANWCNIHMFLMSIKYAVFVSLSTKTQIALFFLYLSGNLTINPQIVNPIFTQESLATIRVRQLQCSMFTQLNTWPCSLLPPVSCSLEYFFQILIQLVSLGCMECRMFCPSFKIFFLRSSIVETCTRMWNLWVPYSWIMNSSAFPLTLRILSFLVACRYPEPLEFPL